MTDSVRVPWGKAEIEHWEVSEIEYESISLQAVGDLFKDWLCACWRMSRRLIGDGKVKVFPEP